MSTTISTFQPLMSSFYQTNKSQIAPKTHCLLSVNSSKCSHTFPHLFLKQNSKMKRVVRSSEEDGQIPESVPEEEAPPVAVPVSPADKLLMFFQAEGTMSDTAISTVTQALQGTEGISDLKVLISEGIASIELTKQTTIQATGVASSLLETIQGAGFRLNTLNLSFEDEESVAV